MSLSYPQKGSFLLFGINRYNEANEYKYSEITRKIMAVDGSLTPSETFKMSAKVQ